MHKVGKQGTCWVDPDGCFGPADRQIETFLTISFLWEWFCGIANMSNGGVGSAWV